MFSRSIFVILIVVMFMASQVTASDSHSSGGSHSHKNSIKTISIKGTQKICPIGKKVIDPDSFIEFQKQKVYFCCPGCDKKFLKDPELYFDQMKQRGEFTESIQKHCSVSGEELDDNKVSLTLPGRKVYFCCKKCVRNFKKDKEKYLKKLDEKVEMKNKNKKEEN